MRTMVTGLFLQRALKRASVRGFARLFLGVLLFSTPGHAFEAPVRIGVLTPAWGAPGGLDGLISGLVDRGYRENEDFVVGVRFTSGDLSQLPEAARAMLDHGVDIIIAQNVPAAKAMLDEGPDLAAGSLASIVELNEGFDVLQGQTS